MQIRNTYKGKNPNSIKRPKTNKSLIQGRKNGINLSIKALNSFGIINTKFEVKFSAKKYFRNLKTTSYIYNCFD